MFPFPQAPFGGTGGMTANQVPQPMQSGMQQSPMQQMVPSQNPMMPQGGGMGPQGGLQQPMPQAQGIDPQQLARLRAMLMQQQQMGGAQMPNNNLRAMLGL